MKNYKKLISLFTPAEKKKLFLLLIMIIVMALLDMAGVASILPFIAVLTNPSLIETNIYLNHLFEFSKLFGVENNYDFFIFLGILVFILLVFSNSVKAFTIFWQSRFGLMSEYSISKRLVNSYLVQPFSWFLNKHSADLGKTILSEVSQVVANGINPLIEVISKSIVSLTLITLLVVVDPELAFKVAIFLSVIYALIFFLLKNFIKNVGKKRLLSNKLRFEAISNAFGAIKEVKVGGLETTYTNLFGRPARVYALAHAFAQVVAQLPRYFVEIFAFGGILLIMLYEIAFNSVSFSNTLPILSLYVFAGYRLLPNLQMLYNSFIKLTFVGPSLDKLYFDLSSLQKNIDDQNKDTLQLKNQIVLRNINYSYPVSSKKNINDISLKIPAKSIVGIVGTTGSGKTTIVDIILGLLVPQKGTVEIDETSITKKNLRSWQKTIGYVPQFIYLADDTIENNIAFGVEPKDIDQNSLDRASKIANLHNFINEELPEKYNTLVGERGLRLSGGQRQRIGIARALYHNPQLLIMDEGTSALDNKTEELVMSSINKLGKEITVILIAHRLSTIKKCDKIFLLENGKIEAEGTYQELVNINNHFKAMSKND